MFRTYSARKYEELNSEKRENKVEMRRNKVFFL
jgi:hypothetical protein